MVNPHGLDDRAGCPPPGQAWDKRELKGADNHVTGDCRHHEELVRVPLKNREGGLVRGQVIRRLPRRAKFVIGQHVHDGRDIG
jgi:hypothetical protein